MAIPGVAIPGVAIPGVAIPGVAIPGLFLSADPPKMNVDGAVVVFRRSDDRPVLLAYRRLPDRSYMVAVFSRGTLRAFATSFSELICIVPIKAATLTTRNALERDVESTLASWAQVCRQALARRNS